MSQRTLEDLRLGLSRLRLAKLREGAGTQPSVAALFEEFDSLLRSASDGDASVLSNGASGRHVDERELFRAHREVHAALAAWSGASAESGPFLRALASGLQADACEHWGFDDAAASETRLQAWRDPSLNTASAVASEPGSDGAAPLADRCEFVEWIEDVERDPRVRGDAWMRRAGICSMLRVPIRSAAARSGSLRVYWRSRRARDAALVELAACCAEHFAQRLLPQGVGPLSRRRDPAWRALAAVTFDALLAVDRTGRVVELNRAAERLLGRERVELLHQSLIALAAPERLREAASRAFTEFAAGAPSNSQPLRLNGVVVRGGGDELAVDLALAPVELELDAQYLLCARAATPPAGAPTVAQAAETARARGQLRALMTELLVAEERERQRLAQDLHDGLSQTLALAQMKLSSIRAGVGRRSATQRDALEELQALIASADRSARSVGFELSPPSLHQLGLAPALRWLVENLQQRYGLAIEFDDGGASRPLDEARRVILFRAVRELLINAAKHSGVDRVSLELRESPQSLLVRVEDRGVGMPSGERDRVGTGLLSIKERLLHIGGALRIRSAPGHGTTVEIEAPWTGIHLEESEGT